MQATQVLGSFLLEGESHGFVEWLRANGEVTPHRAQVCADALRDWCQACPQLKQADEEDAPERGRGGSGAGPSGTGAPQEPSSVGLEPSSDGGGARPSVVSREPPGNLPGPPARLGNGCSASDVAPNEGFLSFSCASFGGRGTGPSGVGAGALTVMARSKGAAAGESGVATERAMEPPRAPPTGTSISLVDLLTPSPSPPTANAQAPAVGHREERMLSQTHCTQL